MGTNGKAPRGPKPDPPPPPPPPRRCPTERQRRPPPDPPPRGGLGALWYGLVMWALSDDRY